MLTFRVYTRYTQHIRLGFTTGCKYKIKRTQLTILTRSQHDHTTEIHQQGLPVAQPSVVQEMAAAMTTGFNCLIEYFYSIIDISFWIAVVKPRQLHIEINAASKIHRSQTKQNVPSLRRMVKRERVKKAIFEVYGRDPSQRHGGNQSSPCVCAPSLLTSVILVQELPEDIIVVIEDINALFGKDRARTPSPPSASAASSTPSESTASEPPRARSTSSRPTCASSWTRRSSARAASTFRC